jgi:hypothetical protein
MTTAMATSRFTRSWMWKALTRFINWPDGNPKRPVLPTAPMCLIPMAKGDAMAVVQKPTVLVHAGQKADGTPRASAVPVDLGLEEVWDPNATPSEVYIGGIVHVQVGQTATGAKVYAPQDVRQR